MSHTNPSSEETVSITKHIQGLMNLRDNVTKQINQEITQLCEAYNLEFVVSLQEKKQEKDCGEQKDFTIHTSPDYSHTEYFEQCYDLMLDKLKNDSWPKDEMKPDLAQLTEEGKKEMKKGIAMMNLDLKEYLEDNKELVREELNETNQANLKTWDGCVKIAMDYIYKKTGLLIENEEDWKAFKFVANAVARDIYADFRRNAKEETELSQSNLNTGAIQNSVGVYFTPAYEHMITQLEKGRWVWQREKPELDELTEQGKRAMENMVPHLVSDLFKKLKELEDNDNKGQVRDELNDIVENYIQKFMSRYVRNSTTLVNYQDANAFNHVARIISVKVHEDFLNSLN